MTSRRQQGELFGEKIVKIAREDTVMASLLSDTALLTNGWVEKLSLYSIVISGMRREGKRRVKGAWERRGSV